MLLMMRLSPEETRCQEVYLAGFNATLHAPKMSAVAQTSFLQSVHARSVEILLHRMLLGEGRISKVMLIKSSIRNHFGCNLPTESIELELASCTI